MRNRKEILTDLVQFRGDVGMLEAELAQHPWDLEEAILVIKKEDFQKIVRKVLRNQISIDDVENWANIVELRDDLDFEDNELKQTIHELANASINYPISRRLLLKMLTSFSENS